MTFYFFVFSRINILALVIFKWSGRILSYMPGY